MKVVFAIILTLVALFCVFGFIASGEPGGLNAYFRIGYPILGTVCLLGALALSIGRRKP